MVRLMAGKKDGFEMRKNLVGAMWQDADVRKKKLGVTEKKNRQFISLEN